ncbi:hypothetical protein [Elioraea sp.]|uniref:hypothetical protein n=1 Tax=Elioraea sp. TaxID=2185103 RepID=UPI003F70D4C9
MIIAHTPCKYKLSRIVVLVGPNGSWKSVLLRDIENLANSDVVPTERPNFSLRRIRFAMDTTSLEKQILTFTEVYSRILQEENQAVRDQVYYRKFNSSNGDISIGVVQRNLFSNFIKSKPEYFPCSHHGFLNRAIVRMDGKARLSILGEKPLGDLLKEPRNILQAIANYDDKRKEVVDRILSAFRRILVVDPTKMKNYRLRLSEVAPKHPSFEWSWTP